MRRREPLLGGGASPAQGFGRIGRYGDAVRKKQVPIALGNTLVDRAGAVVPRRGPAVRPAAMQVGKAEMVLRLAVTLLRCLPEPHDGVGKTANDAFAARI